MLEYSLSWHAQNLMLERHFSWQAQHLVMLCLCDLSWQGQHLVMSECHFSWQAHYWWCTFRGRHHMTWRHTASHDMTWHDISQLTTLHHLASPHNHPQYCISPRSQPLNITYHITANYIINTDTLRKRNLPPPKRQHQTEWPKAGAHKHPGLGIALVDRPARFYRQILSLTYSFFLWNFPPPACPTLLVYSTVKLGIVLTNSRKTVFFEIIKGPLKSRSFWSFGVLRKLKKPRLGPMVNYFTHSKTTWLRVERLFSFLEGLLSEGLC